MQDLSDNHAAEEILVGPDQAGRLDAVLAAAVPTLSRSRAKDLILAGSAAINGQTATDPSRRLRPGDRVRLIAPPPDDPVPAAEDIPLDILYEDDDLIVIDKPAGLVVHPAPGSPAGTLVNALLHHCGDSLSGIGGVRRPGIVHRLDKDTSGVMVVAKTEYAHHGLAAQFADHGRSGPLHRVYIAFAWGRVQQARGVVDAPLGRDSANRLKQAVRSDGREAVTRYSVERRFGGEGWDITRLKCELETGRTHQIRVHMAHIRHPLVADPLYATGYRTKLARLPDSLRGIAESLDRQALHAAELGFEHPRTHEEMLFESPLPGDLAAFEQALEPFDRVNSA